MLTFSHEIDEANQLSRDKRATSTMTTGSISKINVTKEESNGTLRNGAFSTQSVRSRKRRSIGEGEESMTATRTGTLQKNPISTAPQSSSRIINNQDDVSALYFTVATNIALQKNRGKKDHRFTSFFKGKEHTNQATKEKRRRQAFDLEKVSSGSNGGGRKLIVVLDKDDSIKKNKNALWSGGKQLSESYDDDTSGMLQQAGRKESETTERSRTVNPTAADATTISKSWNGIKIIASKKMVAQTKKQVEEESPVVTSSELIIGHGTRHKRTSNNKPSSSKETVSAAASWDLNNKLKSASLSDNEMGTVLSGGGGGSAAIQPSSLPFYFAVGELSKPTVEQEEEEKENFHKQQTKPPHRSKRAPFEPARASNNNNFNINSILPSRHTNGSYRKNSDEINSRSDPISLYDTSSTEPTWKKYSTTLRSNNNAARVEQEEKDKREKKKDTFNFINNNFNNHYENNKVSSNRNNDKVMKSTPLSSTTLLDEEGEKLGTIPSQVTFLHETITTPFSSSPSFSSSSFVLPSLLESATSLSVLVPNPVDDYVNDSDDLVILARSRKRRYGAVTSDTSPTKTFSWYNSNSNGYNRESHQENYVDDNNNNKINFSSDKFPHEPSTYNSVNDDVDGGAYSRDPSFSTTQIIDQLKDTNSSRSSKNGSGGGGAPEKRSVCRDGPHYVVYSWVLCMVSLAAFLKLYFMVKATIIALLFVTYSVFILWPFKIFFVADEGDAGEINK